MSNWLTYSPVSGHGNATITLSASTLTGLEDRIATLIATGSQEGQTLSATTVVTQKHLTLAEIYFENLTWSTDVAWSGGTATSANCSFSIIAKYSDNSTKDITNLANVTGSLVVPATTATTRQSVGTLTLTATYEDKTCAGNVEVYQEAFDFSQEPLTFNITSAGTINWMATEDSAAKTIEYKLNNDGWTSIASDTTGAAITVNSGDKIQFRGDNTAYSNIYSDKNTFSGSTAGFSVEGNIMSLINSTNFATLITLESDYTFNSLFSRCTGLTSAENLVLPATTLAYSCYEGMFQGCTSLINAPELPANTLANNCYREMFYSCTSLIAAPELPATTLAESCCYGMFWNCKSLITVPSDYLSATTLANSCYNSMFQGCTSLTTAPELPASTLTDSCYYEMFKGCTSLTTAPALPATTLASGCYDYMFINCKSLTTAPALPATTLASDCYSSMFADCTSLTVAPELPATTLAGGCYNYMFGGCRNLTTAPELPATTLAVRCYDSMFKNCKSLTTAPALPATTLEYGCYQNMFQGCTSLTTAPELPAITLGYYCYDSMFDGCTSLTKAPELPATTLANYCYQYMFQGCKSLTTAPALPATTLVNYCYSYMFKGCTKLTYIKCLATNISVNNNCTNYWVLGVSSTGTFVKNPNLNIWERDSSSIPEGWTVINAS